MHTTLLNRPLIGLAAKARAGKTTVAEILVNQYSYGQVSFAEPIRQFVSDLTGISRADLEGPLKEVVVPWIGKSPRELMQTLGTEWGREMVTERLWILKAMKSVEDLAWGRIPSVISDVRFDNEADTIRAHGGVVLHLVRPDALHVASHTSEDGVRRHSTDHTIVNDGTLEDLIGKVHWFMNDLRL